MEVVSPYGSLTSSNAQLSVVEPGSFITWAGSATEARTCGRTRRGCPFGLSRRRGHRHQRNIFAGRYRQ